MMCNSEAVILDIQQSLGQHVAGHRLDYVLREGTSPELLSDRPGLITNLPIAIHGRRMIEQTAR